MKMVLTKDITDDRKKVLKQLEDEYLDRLRGLYPGYPEEWLPLVAEAERYLVNSKKGPFPLLTMEAGQATLKDTADKVIVIRDQTNAKVAGLRGRYKAIKEKLAKATKKSDLRIDELNTI